MLSHLTLELGISSSILMIPENVQGKDICYKRKNIMTNKFLSRDHIFQCFKVVCIFSDKQSNVFIVVILK